MPKEPFQLGPVRRPGDKPTPAFQLRPSGAAAEPGTFQLGAQRGALSPVDLEQRRRENIATAVRMLEAAFGGLNARELQAQASADVRPYQQQAGNSCFAACALAAIEAGEPARLSVAAMRQREADLMALLGRIDLVRPDGVRLEPDTISRVEGGINIHLITAAKSPLKVKLTNCSEPSVSVRANAVINGVRTGRSVLVNNEMTTGGISHWTMICGVTKSSDQAPLAWQVFDPLASQLQTVDTTAVAKRILGALGGATTSGDVVQMGVQSRDR